MKIKFLVVSLACMNTDREREEKKREGGERDTHTQRKRWMDKQATDGHTDRQTDRLAERHGETTLEKIIWKCYLLALFYLQDSIVGEYFLQVFGFLSLEPINVSQSLFYK